METPAFFKEALESAIPEAYPNKETDENAEERQALEEEGMEEEDRQREREAERAHYKKFQQVEEIYNHLKQAVERARQAEQEEERREVEEWGDLALRSGKPNQLSMLSKFLDQGYISSENLLAPTEKVQRALEIYDERRRKPKRIFEGKVTADPNYMHQTKAETERIAAREREDARSHRRRREKERKRQALEEHPDHETTMIDQHHSTKMSSLQADKEERVLRTIDHRSKFLEAPSSYVYKTSEEWDREARDAVKLPSINTAFGSNAPGGILCGKRTKWPLRMGHGGNAIVAEPSQLHFFDFHPGHALTKRVLVRNMCATRIPIEIYRPPNETFAVMEVKRPGDESTVPPGLACTVSISMLADSYRGARSSLVASCPFGRVDVPLIAERPRPEFYLPEPIELQRTLCGGPGTRRRVQLHNKGESGAIQLSALEGSANEHNSWLSLEDHFQVYPSVLNLPADEQRVLTVYFAPPREFPKDSAVANLMFKDELGEHRIRRIFAEAVQPQLAVEPADGPRFEEIDAGCTSRGALRITNECGLKIPFKMQARSLHESLSVWFEPESGVIDVDQPIEIDFYAVAKESGTFELDVSLLIARDAHFASRDTAEWEHYWSRRVSVSSRRLEASFAPPGVWFGKGVDIGVQAKRELRLENRSSAVAHFRFEPCESSSGTLWIDPPYGELNPLSSRRAWAMALSSVPGSDKLNARCIIFNGPEFEFSAAANFYGPRLTTDVPWLDFGSIKLGGNPTKVLRVQNKTNVPLASFELHPAKGISVEPSKSCAPAHGYVEVTVSLSTVEACARDFQETIECRSLDSGGEGFSILAAALIVEPKVYFDPPSVDLGTQFVDRAAPLNSVLVNLTSMPIEVVPSAELLHLGDEGEEGMPPKGDASIALPEHIAVDSNSELELEFSVTPTRKGRLDALLCCEVKGSEHPAAIRIQGKVEGLRTSLMVQKSEEGSKPVELPEKPPIVVDIGECPLNQSKEAILTLRNPTGVASSADARLRSFPMDYDDLVSGKRLPPYGMGIATSAEPADKTLAPHSNLLFHLVAVGSFPGEYEDILELDVEGLPRRIILVRVTVTGSPIIASPYRMWSSKLAMNSNRMLVDFGIHPYGSQTKYRKVFLYNTSPIAVAVSLNPHEYGIPGNFQSSATKEAEVTLELHDEQPDAHGSEVGADDKDTFLHAKNVSVSTQPIPQQSPGPFAVEPRKIMLHSCEQLQALLSFDTTRLGKTDGVLRISQEPAWEGREDARIAVNMQEDPTSGWLKCRLMGSWLPWASLKEGLGLPTRWVRLSGGSVASQLRFEVDRVRLVNKQVNAVPVFQEVNAVNPMPYAMRVRAYASGPFSVEEPADEVHLAPCGVMTLRVGFNPPDSRRNDRADYECSGQVDFQLDGRFTQALPVIAQRKRPYVELDKEKVDFGTVYFRSTVVRTLRVRNPGPVDAHVKLSVEGSSAFALLNQPEAFTLSATEFGRFEEMEFRITFCPQTYGTYSGHLCVAVNRGRYSYVSMSGEASIREDLEA